MIDVVSSRLKYAVESVEIYWVAGCSQSTDEHLRGLSLVEVIFVCLINEAVLYCVDKVIES